MADLVGKVKTYVTGSEPELAEQEIFNVAAVTGHSIKAGLLFLTGFAGHGLLMAGGMVMGADLGVRYLNKLSCGDKGRDVDWYNMPGIIGTYKQLTKKK